MISVYLLSTYICVLTLSLYIYIYMCVYTYVYMYYLFRLRRLREQEDEQRLREAMGAERTLKELAAARGRSVPMSQMPSLNSHGRQPQPGRQADETATPRSRPSSVGSSRRTGGNRGAAAPRHQVYILLH